MSSEDGRPGLSSRGGQLGNAGRNVYAKPDIAARALAMGLIQSAASKFDPFLDSPIVQTYATSAAYEADE